MRLLHAFAERYRGCRTPTAGYDDLRAELSYKWKPARRGVSDLTEASFGIVGTNLLNRDIRGFAPAD